MIFPTWSPPTSLMKCTFAHANEAIKLMPSVLENFEYADIVRGSTEDFGNMFSMTDADKVYQHKVGFYCPNFICTNGG